MIRYAAAALTLVIAAPAAAQPAQAPAHQHDGHGRHQPHGGAQHGGHGAHGGAAGHGQHGGQAHGGQHGGQGHGGQHGGQAKHSCDCCKPGQPKMACCEEHGEPAAGAGK
jgi:hypothetical protein